MDGERLDCLVIGGGAAGLSASIYFGRYRRRAVLVDDGGSRLRWIPRTRNVPGFPGGIEGPELLRRMQAQAAEYGVPAVGGRVRRLARAGDGFVAEGDGGQRWHARFVLLATGARDVPPEIDGLESALQCGQVRFCPICDGYETQGQRVAVLGKGRHGLREALFVAGFENEVTWLSMATHDDVPAQDLAAARAAGVRLAASSPRVIACSRERGVQVDLLDGQVLSFDTLYPALGLRHAHELATALGARAQRDGQLEVDAHQQTSVAGLYAA